MALPTLTMPAGTPDWEAVPHVTGIGSPFAEIPFEVGAPRLRRVSTGMPHTLQAQMLLNGPQAAAVWAWFEGSLEAGAQPFAGVTLAPSGARQWWHMRFVAPPQWVMVAAWPRPLWRMVAALRLEGTGSAVPPV